MRWTALLVVAVPTLALAQPAPRSAGVDARALHQVASCLIKADARRAAAFLATAPTEPQTRLLADLQEPLAQCAADVGGEGTQLRLSAAALRGPIAEALFERDFNGWSARSGRRPLAVYPLTPPPAQVPRARMLADMAACVADQRPAEVLALLRTEPASAGESQATEALVPALAPCFRAGESADVTRAQLRGLLAEAAYRRAALATGSPRPTSS